MMLGMGRIIWASSESIYYSGCSSVLYFTGHITKVVSPRNEAQHCFSNFFTEVQFTFNETVLSVQFNGFGACTQLCSIFYIKVQIMFLL